MRGGFAVKSDQEVPRKIAQTEDGRMVPNWLWVARKISKLADLGFAGVGHDGDGIRTVLNVVEEVGVDEKIDGGRQIEDDRRPREGGDCLLQADFWTICGHICGGHRSKGVGVRCNLGAIGVIATGRGGTLGVMGLRDPARAAAAIITISAASTVAISAISLSIAALSCSSLDKLCVDLWLVVVVVGKSRRAVCLQHGINR